MKSQVWRAGGVVTFHVLDLFLRGPGLVLQQAIGAELSYLTP
jgi:hypothetical protein